MKLTLTDEQNMLAQSVRRFVDDTFSRSVPATGHDASFDPELWRKISDLGWLAAGVTEAAGGFGGPREMAVVMEGAGSTALADQLTSVFLSLTVLEATGGQDDLVAAVTAGQAVICGLLPDMGTQLDMTGAGETLRVSGRFPSVTLGDGAEQLLLALPSVTLLIRTDILGVDRHIFRAMDGATRADIKLTDLVVTPDMILAEGTTARTALERARLCHASALTAECCGLAGRLFQDTLTYVQQREQFGQPIARFQALQHRLADMFIALEELRSLALAASRAAEGGTTASRPLSQAVVGSIDRALHIAKEAIQIHGAVAMTDDLPLGAGLRRIKVLQLMPGGGETHRHALLAAQG